MIYLILMITNETNDITWEYISAYFFKIGGISKEKSTYEETQVKLRVQKENSASSIQDKKTPRLHYSCCKNISCIFLFLMYF